MAETLTLVSFDDGKKDDGRTEPAARLVCGCETVLCEGCAALDSRPSVPLWLENIMPYRQSCHSCGRVVSKGRTPAWCELYSSKTSVLFGDT